MSQSVSWTVTCTECGADATRYCTQTLVHDQLRLDIEVVCSGCSLCLAINCGTDRPDSELRDRMLASAAFGLQLDTAPSVAKLAQLIGQHEGLDSRESLAKARLLVAPGWRGTEPEAAFYVYLLAKQKVLARVTVAD